MKRLLLLLFLMCSCDPLFVDIYESGLIIRNDTDFHLFVYFEGYSRKNRAIRPQVQSFNRSDHFMAENHAWFTSKYDWGKMVKDSIMFFIYDSNGELDALEKEKRYLEPDDIMEYKTKDNLVGTLVLTHADLKKERKFHFPPREYGHVVYNPDNEHGRKLMETVQ